ncbi:MAG: pirin family protein [Luteibaculaceae bacterium]
MQQVGFNHLPEVTDKISANTVLHKAETRGGANHGWLNAKHTFSFARYYNPERMNFGVLRVLNDDFIQGGGGFPTHPHDNMEIITIPLTGSLEHKDSMGNIGVIQNGEIQVMSAGTGVRHSEYNHSAIAPVTLLQIWLFPNKRAVKPRYQQIKIDTSKMENNLAQILSPNPFDEGVWIHQDSWFHLGKLKKGFSHEYKVKKAGNGLYAFVISGKVTINGQPLEMRDGFGIWNFSSTKISASDNAELLLMEVPMGV